MTSAENGIQASFQDAKRTEKNEQSGMEFKCAGEMQEPHESRSGRKCSYAATFFFFLIRTDRKFGTSESLLTDVEALRPQYLLILDHHWKILFVSQEDLYLGQDTLLARKWRSGTYLRVES